MDVVVGDAKVAITRISEGKELVFVTDFFKMLWEGGTDHLFHIW